MREHDQRGFTLIEIVIVLVILGLLMGGVLKGQELITSARVRSVTALIDGVKAAFYGFQDRYRSLPGDYVMADRTLKCPGGTCLRGNGDGVIERNAVPLAGSEPNEATLVWTHLTAAGLMNGSYAMTAGETLASDVNTPKNPFNIYLQIVYDGRYADKVTPAANRHNLKTGALVPVEIAAEVDRKADDGNGLSGSFRFSTYGDAASGGNAPAAPPAPAATYAPGQCVSDAGVWYVAQGEVNCGGANLL
ncbi:MAG: prepilin-type N-terminal cleavage/methylation domain-containing protein [Burkholderiales bacterium]|nr:prepilin-type N-terminal cleavage/methylation domain-containing protein [Burkholderiales bacterium]